MSDVSTKDKRAGARFKMRVNGEDKYPINDCSDVKDAWDLRGRAKGVSQEAVEAHVRRAAKALGCKGPWSDATQERGILSPVLVLEGDLGEVEILTQEGQGADSNGVMRIKVPFYVGDSISRAPGFDMPIHFSGTALPGIVQEGLNQIAAGKQPLTTYARHSHALNADHLPVGQIVGLEHDGRVGRATIDVYPTPIGQEIQTLVQHKALNAVSLRSSDYELEEAKVNGELMLECKALRLAGIDFAPDGPAQPTFGIEVLAAEAVIEPVSTPLKEELVSDELTLEGLRKEHSDLVAQIESPLREQIASLTSEKETLKAAYDTLMSEKTQVEKEAFLRDLAQKFPEPDKALGLLQEKCKDAKSAAECQALAFPLILDAMSAAKAAAPAPATETVPSLDDQLRSLFVGSGSGRPLTQESVTDPEPEGETAFGLAIPE